MVQIIYKWVIGIFNHPINVFKGNWFRLFNKNEKLYHARYQKCIFCQEHEQTPIGIVCGMCGCPLESKLRVKEEKCELDKWK